MWEGQHHAPERFSNIVLLVSTAGKKEPRREPTAPHGADPVAAVGRSHPYYFPSPSQSMVAPMLYSTWQNSARVILLSRFRLPFWSPWMMPR